MQTDERPDLNQTQDPGVQYDRETPLPQKPSVLFLASTLTIITIFVTVVVMAYNGFNH